MKITESTLALQAQASRTSRLQVNESLEVWRGTRSTGAEPSLSTAGRQALQAEESAAPPREEPVVLPASEESGDDKAGAELLKRLVQPGDAGKENEQ